MNYYNKIRLKKIITAILCCFMFFSFIFSGLNLIKTNKETVSAATLSEAQTLSDLWNNYESNAVSSTDGVKVVELNDFIAAGFRATGETEWGDIVETSWTYSDAVALIGGEDAQPEDYCFLISNARELMYFSYFANGQHPSVQSMANLTDVQTLFLNSNFKLGNNIYYDGRTYFIYDGTNVLNPESNANYSGAAYGFKPVINFNGSFNGQGFEIINLSINGYSYQSGVDTLLYSSMFIGCSGNISDFGLLKTTIDINAYDCTIGQDLAVISSYTSSIANLKNLYAIDTKYINIGTNTAFNSSIFSYENSAPVSDQYYIQGSYYYVDETTSFSMSLQASDFDSNTVNSNGDLLWYSDGCQYYNSDLTEAVSYREDGHTIAEYNYYKLHGMRKIGYSITFDSTEFTDYSLYSSSLYNFYLYQPADVIYYLDSLYLAEHRLGVIKNDLDFNTISKYSYFSAYAANSGVTGLLGYKQTISSNLVINIDTFAQTSAMTINGIGTPTSINNVNIYNLNNKTYRVSTSLTGSVTYILSGLFENTYSSFVLGNLNFIGGYTAMAKEAMDNANIVTDENGIVTSITNEAIIEYGYAVGLIARISSLGATVFNVYSSMDVYLEEGENLYIHEINLGGLAGRIDFSSSSRYNIVYNCVISGNVTGGRACTYANSYNIYIGGIYGYFSSGSGRNYSYDKLVFSGIVTGFKPQYSTRTDALIYATSYTGGFAGRYNTSSLGTKKLSSILVNGTVQTLPAKNDTNNYTYSTSVNIYAGGMIGYDVTGSGLMIQGGTFRFSGKLIYNTYYSDNASTNYINFYAAMYAGRYNNAFNYEGSTLYAKADTSSLTDADIICGSFYSYNTTDGQNFVLSNENEISFSNSLSRNYVSTFIAAKNGNTISNCVNQLPIKIVGGECYYAYAYPFGNSVSGLYNVINEADITISNLSAAYIYIGGICNYINNGSSSPAVSTDNCINYGDLILQNNTVNNNIYGGGLFNSIGSNTIINDVKNYGDINFIGNISTVYFGGIAYSLSNSTSTILNCINYGNFNGNDMINKSSFIGGIIGQLNNGTIDNCINNGNFNNNIDFSAISSSMHYRWGGIVGYAYDSNIIANIKNCINNGNITFTPLSNTYEILYTNVELNLGGIVGYSRTRILNISDTVNTGNITIEKYNNNSFYIKSYRYFARFGGIIGFEDGNSNARALTLKSVINYGNIINGYANGGIIGLMSTSVDGGLYINGAVNYGDVYSENVYMTYSSDNFYTVGNGGIIGLLAGSGFDINNLVNYGKIINQNSVYDFTGGIIGQYVTDRNSDNNNFNNLSRTPADIGVFNGALYIINDISVNYADSMVGNIVLNNSYSISNNLAIATPVNATVILNTGAELYEISESDTNGIFGDNFFWSINNEKHYDTIIEKSFTLNSDYTVTIDETEKKAIDTSQIVFSEKATYGNTTFDSNGFININTAEINQARGHNLNGTEYLFALTTSSGRRDGQYIGENFNKIDETTVNYIKQIDLSRDYFINNYAIGDGGISNIVLTDTINNINFSNAMISEKLNKAENEYDTLFVNVLNHGEYINAADALGASYVNFIAYSGINRNFVINGGEENIFSNNCRIAFNNIIAVEFDYVSGNPNWNFIAYKAEITVWQGGSETVPPADINYYQKYNLYIMFIDVENSLTFKSLNANGVANYTPEDIGYNYSGDTVIGTHTFANDIQITSNSDYNLDAVFAADGVPNNTSGRDAVLNLSAINSNADYSSFGYTTGDIDISSGLWSFTSSYVPDDSSGTSAELQELIDELGEGGIYLKSTITFNLVLNSSFNELPAGSYYLTLKIYKGRENSVDVYYEHTFVLVKALSEDTSLQFSGSSSTSGVSLFFRDGATYTVSSSRGVGFSIDNYTFTGTYTFGYFPDFEKLNIDGNTMMNIFSQGMASPIYSKTTLPKSVTITTNENGTHSITFIFDVISEAGISNGTNLPMQEYTFILNEPTPSVSVVVYKDSLPLGSLIDDVGRGTDPTYLLDYNISTSGVNIKNNTIKMYNDYNLIDVNNLDGIIPPEIEVYAVNEFNVKFSKEVGLVTTGGDWMLCPYLIYGEETGINVTVKTEPAYGNYSTEIVNVEWDDLTVSNIEVHLIKQTSRLCYAQDIGITNSQLGVLSYYGTTNSTFEDGCGLVGQGSFLIDQYRKYSYNYGTINTDVSGGLISKYRIKNFVNYLTIGNDEILGDYYYSTYLIVATNKSTDESLLYNDGYTTVKYKILGQNSTIPDYVNMDILNVDDPLYNYYVFWMDESISVASGSESLGMSLRIRLTAENALYYTEYDFIFKTPLKNKNITLNVTTEYDTDLLGTGSIWDNNYANIGLKTGFYSAENDTVSYTRNVNMLYMLSNTLAGGNELFSNFLADEIATDTYYKSYKMINYLAARYYFYFNMPDGYKAVVSGVKILIGGVYIDITQLTPSDGIYSYVKADFTEWLYLSEDLSYFELGGTSASNIVIDVSIVPSTSINPPPWGVEI